jgi:imidazolonepropionase-like amidohydrolase
MLTRAILAFMLLPLCACKPTEESHMKAIIGAVLIDGEGGPPVSNSVVVVARDRIRAAGASSTVPIPAEADKIDGSGRFLVPALVEVSSGVPISSLAEVESHVKSGATAFIGMIRDTENLDPEFLATLRNLRVVFAPALAAAGDRLEVAKRNTRRLFQAGVLIALAPDGRDAQREIELLQDAGLPPLDAIVAATRNGTIQPGKAANLLLLSANPGEDVRNLRKVALKMVNGEWVP